jgi:glutamate synthase (ferredoxin)
MTTYYNLQKYLILIIVPTENLDYETRLRLFGYTEDLKTIITPMGAKGAEAISSMGNDTPLAILSDQPQLLYNYFKQLFAQVTNPFGWNS